MNRFTVRFFARYAELFGAEELEVTLPSIACVSDLIDALRNLPGGVSLPSNPFVAVNRSQAGPFDPIAAGDEIAILPPLAGG